MAVQVTNAELSRKLQFGGLHPEECGSVGRIIKGYGSGSGPLAFYVLDEDITITLVLGHVGL